MLHDYYSTCVDSPVGQLQLVASAKGLCGVYFDGAGKHEDMRMRGAQDGSGHPLLVKAQKQLEEYFAGKRTAFDLKLDMQGTVFQIKSWKELCNIPYGQTISYGEQATRVGDVKKARAVGAANGRNPISIIVPCHRVIGASGSLVGFGGGLKTKELLLTLEQKVLASKKAA